MEYEYVLFGIGSKYSDKFYCKFYYGNITVACSYYYQHVLQQTKQKKKKKNKNKNGDLDILQLLI